jgi:hypothetical protein
LILRRGKGHLFIVAVAFQSVRLAPLRVGPPILMSRPVGQPTALTKIAFQRSDRAHFDDAGWLTHWAWRTTTQRSWGYQDVEVPRGAKRPVVVVTWDEPAASAGAAAAVDYDLDLWMDRAPFCSPDALGQCGEWASQAAISATIVRGDTTLPMAFTVSGPTGPAAPRVGQTVTITTTVANPSWILSGVYLAATSMLAGVGVRRSSIIAAK